MKIFQKIAFVFLSICLYSHLHAQDITLIKSTADKVYYTEFISPTEAWIAGGSNTFLKLIKSGNTWNATQQSASFLQQFGSGVHDFRGMDFIDANTGLIALDVDVAPAPIYKSTNGGVSWLPFSQVFGARRINMLKFYNASYGVACSHTGLFITLNGGTSWTKQTNLPPSIGTSDKFYHCYLHPDGTIYVTMEDGFSIHGNSGAYTLNNLAWIDDGIPAGFQSEPIKDVYFSELNVGWICGLDTVDTRYSLMKNTGSGWSPVMVPQNTQPNSRLNSILFQDPQHGYLGNNLGEVFRTADAGDSWTLISPSPIQQPINNMSAVPGNINESIVTCDNGVFLILDTNTGIEDEILTHKLTIFPNPTNGYVHLDLTRPSRVKVVNSVGTVLMETNVNAGSQLLDLHSIPDGLYHVLIYGDDHFAAGKVILKK
ncbi:MAG: T9SS type A sorting domain-containing protein [Bacteroidetes bacterium]|nr:T9SS type A sorting domain-containing protein [Bacteroidota bacterium]